MSERLEVRLDPEHRRRLEVVVQARGERVSDVIRELIDEAYELAQRERRLRAARELAALAVEDVPQVTELSRQLDQTYEPSGLR